MNLNSGQHRWHRFNHTENIRYAHVINQRHQYLLSTHATYNCLSATRNSPILVRTTELHFEAHFKVITDQPHFFSDHTNDCCSSFRIRKCKDVLAIVVRLVLFSNWIETRSPDDEWKCPCCRDHKLSCIEEETLAGHKNAETMGDRQTNVPNNIVVSWQHSYF